MVELGASHKLATEQNTNILKEAFHYKIALDIPKFLCRLKIPLNIFQDFFFLVGLSIACSFKQALNVK